MPAPGQVVLQHGRRGLLDLQEERVLLVAALQQDDERARADAADADDLARHVDDLEPLEQVPAVGLQRRAVGAELASGWRRQSSSEEIPYVAYSSRDGTTIGGWLTMRYSPSTSSPSLESACRLSRVRAFASAFSTIFRRCSAVSRPACAAAGFPAFPAFLVFCFLPAAFALSAASSSAAAWRSMVISSSSVSREYQMSMTPIWAKSAMARR